MNNKENDMIRRGIASRGLRKYAERKAQVNGIEYANGILAAAVWIEGAVPSATDDDFVQVVRCKDCMWFAYEKGELQEVYKITGCYRLKELGREEPILASSNGFCSWGKRREYINK